ncbi:MAG: F0F1 ATP synthase subunit alpha, partial [Dehalococcoidia bacterium]|nr:F0F1 ATP synthase subunit alpha [Dehalococcoidia bacterium]
ITDGQIFLESDLFNSGIRPAINVGLSVSRVGSAAQTKIMKSASSGLKGEHAQFRELQAFAQFGTSDLDAATRRQLERGLRVNEVLKQGQFQPLDLAEESIVILALKEGFLDDVAVEKVGDFEAGLRSYLSSNHPELMQKIEAERVLSDEIAEQIRSAVKSFKDTVPY